MEENQKTFATIKNKNVATDMQKCKEETQKLSYDQLEILAKQLSAQNKELVNKLEQSMQLNFYKRLDYLFKVIEFKTSFNQEFVDNCANEVVAIITPPEDNSEEKE